MRAQRCPAQYCWWTEAVQRLELPPGAHRPQEKCLSSLSWGLSVVAGVCWWQAADRTESHKGFIRAGVTLTARSRNVVVRCACN